MKITICPNCGSSSIKKFKRNWTDTFQGQTYTVPSLEFYECPICGERVYDRQAMRKIEEYSPALAQKVLKRKDSVRKPKAA